MCVIAAKYFKDVGWVGVKNRDRNYKPTITIKQSNRRGVERLYLYDDKTKYTEGLNEFGIAIILASIDVKNDETEGFLNSKIYSHSLDDGLKIRTALFENSVDNVIEKLIELEISGNILVFSKDNCVLMEAWFNDDNYKEYDYQKKVIPKSECVVRTNHGLFNKKTGYDKNINPEGYESSVTRYKQALKGVEKCDNPNDMIDAISDTSNANFMLNPLRTNDSHGKHILKTTGQLLLVPAENTLHYRPIWCEMDFSTFSRINNKKSKCYYEIISSRKLLTMKENIYKYKGIEKMKFKDIIEAVLEGKCFECDGVELTEKNITNEKELSAYANALADEAFGDKKDDKIVKDIVQNAIKKATKDGDTDWATAAGIVNNSIGNN